MKQKKRETRSFEEIKKMEIRNDILRLRPRQHEYVKPSIYPGPDLSKRNVYHAVITESNRERALVARHIKEEEAIQAEIDNVFNKDYGHLYEHKKDIKIF